MGQNTDPEGLCKFSCWAHLQPLYDVPEGKHQRVLQVCTVLSQGLHGAKRSAHKRLPSAGLLHLQEQGHTAVNSLTDRLPSESLMMNSASVFSDMPMLFSSSADDLALSRPHTAAPDCTTSFAVRRRDIQHERCLPVVILDTRERYWSCFRCSMPAVDSLGNPA